MLEMLEIRQLTRGEARLLRGQRMLMLGQRVILGRPWLIRLRWTRPCAAQSMGRVGKALDGPVLTVWVMSSCTMKRSRANCSIMMPSCTTTRMALQQTSNHGVSCATSPQCHFLKDWLSAGSSKKSTKSSKSSSIEAMSGFKAAVNSTRKKKAVSHTLPFPWSFWPMFDSCRLHQV